MCSTGDSYDTGMTDDADDRWRPIPTTLEAGTCPEWHEQQRLESSEARSELQSPISRKRLIPRKSRVQLISEGHRLVPGKGQTRLSSEQHRRRSMPYRKQPNRQPMERVRGAPPNNMERLEHKVDTLMRMMQDLMNVPNSRSPHSNYAARPNGSGSVFAPPPLLSGNWCGTGT
jgi:hypothetical protein